MGGAEVGAKGGIGKESVRPLHVGHAPARPVIAGAGTVAIEIGQVYEMVMPPTAGGDVIT